MGDAMEPQDLNTGKFIHRALGLQSTNTVRTTSDSIRNAVLDPDSIKPESSSTGPSDPNQSSLSSPSGPFPDALRSIFTHQEGSKK